MGPQARTRNRNEFSIHPGCAGDGARWDEGECATGIRGWAPLRRGPLSRSMYVSSPWQAGEEVPDYPTLPVLN